MSDSTKKRFRSRQVHIRKGRKSVYSLKEGSASRKGRGVIERGTVRLNWVDHRQKRLRRLRTRMSDLFEVSQREVRPARKIREGEKKRRELGSRRVFGSGGGSLFLTDERGKAGKQPGLQKTQCGSIN